MEHIIKNPPSHSPRPLPARLPSLFHSPLLSAAALPVDLLHYEVDIVMLPPAMKDMGIECSFQATSIEGLTGTMVINVQLIESHLPSFHHGVV